MKQYLFFLFPVFVFSQNIFAQSKVPLSKQTNKWLAQQEALAKADNVAAVEKLADFYYCFRGYGTEALQYARQGDRLGSIKCTILTAKWLDDNADSSLAYFRKAALAGNAYAMNRAGNRLMLKVISTKDTLGKGPAFAEAKKWLQLAADNGIAGAADNIEELNMAVDKPLQKGLAAYEKRDYLTAFKYFTAGTEYWRDKDCMFAIAGMYYEGLGTEKDLTIARNLYSKLGNSSAVASYWTGFIYWTYFQNGTDAVAWLRKAAALGDSRAQPLIDNIFTTIEQKKAWADAEYQVYLEKKERDARAYHPMTDLRAPAATFQYGTKKSYDQLQREHEEVLRAASEKTFERSQKDYYRP